MAHRRKNPLAGINFLRYAEGGSKYQPPKKAPAPSRHERLEHHGRLPQPGVPEGPRNDLDPTTVPPPLSSQTSSPTRPPIQTVPGVPLLTQISDFLTPGPNVKETAEAAQRLGVKPREVPQQIGDTAGDAVKAVKSGIKELASDVAAAAKLPNQHVDSFLGQKTLGTPTPNQILRAAQKGQVRTNQKGKLTLPATRQAAQRLAHLRQKAQNAGIPGLSPDEQTFVKAVSRGTGGILHPRTVAAWTHQEGGNSTGDWNRLNIGHTDSGALPLTADPRWRDPEQAGELTAAFLRGEYGGPSQGIKDILPKAKGLPPAQQLQVIAGSGWAGDPQYASHLQSVLASTPAAQPRPGLAQKLKQATFAARQLGINPHPDVSPSGHPDVVFVRADAKGAVDWAESALGTKEGSARQVGWASLVGGVTDPWCAVFVSADMQRRGLPAPSNPSYSGAFLEGWSGGKKLPTNDLGQAKPGDILVFDWGDGGETDHVALYKGSGRMIGGNESDEVQENDVPSENIVGIVRPNYKGGKVPVRSTTPLPTVAPGGGIISTPAGAAVEGTAIGAPAQQKAPPEVASSEAVPTSPLLATGAALPAAYQQFQLGTAPESEEAGGEDIIQRLLRRRRV